MRDWIPFFDWFLRLLLGSKQERDLKELRPLVDFVNLFERAVHDRSDEWLRNRTDAYQQLLADGVDPEIRNDHYLEMLKEAQETLQSMDPAKKADQLRERLHANREELSEKYEGDAFQVAIEKPLKPENVEGLAEAYEDRIRDWQDDTLESLEQRYLEGWEHFTDEMPDDEREKALWLLLPEAFSVVREAAHRRLGLRHYDVQVLGGIVFHQGRIGEMKTGEGKTLAATMPLYLNALTGDGAHLVTVNDYLAKRDSKWMGEIYDKLGMEAGLLQGGMSPDDRKPEYEAPITYGTNNEFGFDYLRDNMAVRPEDTVQPERNFCIIDEVDSVLIDEARTPLIISGRADKPVKLYKQIDRVVRQLNREEHYELDEKRKSVNLTDPGSDKVEAELELDNLYDSANMDLVHHIQQSIRAHELYEKDAEYVVQDGEVLIVDQFTGRLQPGRRFSEGLHQAIEAKEGVEIEQENQTLATITIQNYFRMYNKLAGMTGTADTEAGEFQEIYDLDVVVVPTNEPDIRVDYEDAIYKTEPEKMDAVVDEIEHLHEEGKPVLVGTIDIDKSELLGQKLQRQGIPHNILNAKNHEREAAIIAQAGQPGAVTIATNMAGRGTDIVLGEGVIEDECPVESEEPEEDPYCPHDPICGLHVIGTERHDSRRIDNQLRGRTARQGDPGASRFFVSLEDELMQLFGSDKIQGMLGSLGLEEGQRIEHNWISKSIKRAQGKVESHNFEIRKRLLEYDDVMEQQRGIIYSARQKALYEEDVSEMIFDLMEYEVDYWMEMYAETRRPPEDWELEELFGAVKDMTAWEPDDDTREEWMSLSHDEFREALLEKLHELYDDKEEELGEEVMRDVESQLLLRVVDSRWKQHLYAMDSLKQGIQLESFSKKDPLAEYKRESYELFEELQVRMREDLLKFLFLLETVSEEDQPEQPASTQIEKESSSALAGLIQDDTAQSQEEAVQSGSSGGEGGSTVQTVVKDDEPGRNDPCPCGSGKKYKYCCGR